MNFDTSFPKIESAHSQIFFVSFMSEVKFIKEGIFLKFIMNFTHMIILIYNFFFLHYVHVCYELQVD